MKMKEAPMQEKSPGKFAGRVPLLELQKEPKLSLEEIRFLAAKNAIENGLDPSSVKDVLSALPKLDKKIDVPNHLKDELFLLLTMIKEYGGENANSAVYSYLESISGTGRKIGEKELTNIYTLASRNGSGPFRERLEKRFALDADRIYLRDSNIHRGNYDGMVWPATVEF